MNDPSPARAVCVFVLLLAGLSTAAQDTYDDVLARLDAAEYVVRQAATEQLLTDDSLSPDAIATWAGRELSPEQQHRLLAVARHHTLRQMRLAEFPAEGPGSIGVVQSIQTPPAKDEPAPAGVLITKILPGFPSVGRLYVGDVILAINGDPVEEGPAKDELFRARMSQFRAGRVIRLTIQRGDNTIEVDLTLANGAALPQMYPKINNKFKLAPRFVEGWQEERRSRFTTLAPQLLKSPQ
ncbi:MAG: PDZ domain-containing protein [Planctomycetota bacterium]